MDEEALEPLKAVADLTVLGADPDAPKIPSEDQLLAAVADADVALTAPGHPFTARVVAGAPKLKLIATMGTGYDNIDLEAARRHGIEVTNAPGVLDDTTADLAFALMLATSRGLVRSERRLRDGGFTGWTPTSFLGTDVHGKTLGIVGLGRIGQAVAKRARGFDMKLLYTGRAPKPDVAAALGAEFVSMDALLERSDFVSLHVPLTKETRHLIDAKSLAKMKREAILINTARGPVVDEGALGEALTRGELGGAGIDVYEREPTIHPALLAAPRTVLLPHIGSATAATRRRMVAKAVENILAFLEGRPVANSVL